MDVGWNETSGTVEIYSYTPSAPAGWTFVVLFAAVTVVHLVLMFRYRTAFFIPFVIGGIMEAGGYYGRVWSSRGPDNFSAYVLYASLVVPAPVFLSATIYVALGRMIHALDAKEHALIGPRATTCIFVINDVLCFCIQIAGLGLQATTSPSVQETGKTVVLVSLVFQLLVFGFFILNAVKLHTRNRRDPSTVTLQTPNIGWEKHMWAIYALSVCIVVRNIVRIAEYAEGHDGTIVNTEALLYVFDAALMFIVMLIYAVVHPGMLLRRIRKARLNQAGSGDWTPMSEHGAYRKQRKKLEG